MNVAFSDLAHTKAEASAARERGDHEEAAKLSRAAIQLAPEENSLRLDLAEDLRQSQQLDEAATTYLEAVTREPSLSAGFRGLAMIARQRGDRAAAVEYFRTAAAADPDNVWPLYELADELRDVGQLEEAAAAYRAMIAKDPRISRAWRGLALVARLRGDHADSLNFFQVATIFDPADIWDRLDAAMEMRELGRLDQSSAAYREVLAKDASISHAWRGLGLLLRQSGNRVEALACFQKAAELNPESVWDLQDAATEMLELGRLDQAAAASQEIIARRPDFSAAWNCLALIASRRGARAEALQHLRKVTELEPGNPWALLDIANNLRELGRLKESETAYAAAAAAGADPSHIERGFGLLARANSDHVKALVHFRAAAGREPENMWTHYDVAASLRALGQHEEAEQVLADVVERHPDAVEMQLAYAQFIRHRVSSAEYVALLEKAARIAPDHVGVKLDLADEMLRNWRLEEAERLCDSVLAHDRENVRALMSKGQIARRRGDSDAALEFFQAAAAAPNSPDWALLEVVVELRSAGRRDQAKELLETEAARTNRPDLYQQIGYLARETGDAAAARIAFAKAVELDPQSDSAQIDLAEEEFRNGRAVAGIDAVRTYLTNHPDNPRALSALANFAEQIDDMESAVALRRSASNIDPTNVWAQMQLAQALSKCALHAEAEETLRDCEIRLGDSPEIRVARARRLSDLGESSEALALLRQSVAAFPDHFELWAQLVGSLIGRGAYEEAREALEAPRKTNVREAARVYQLRGALAAAEWDHKEAYTHFAKGAAITPDDGWLHECAGRSAMFCYEFVEARRHLETAARLNPSHRVYQRGGVKPLQSLLGQLFDEFRLDREAVALLRDAAQAKDVVDALSSLIPEFPDSTPVAIALMVALRRQGLLVALDAMDRGAPSVIPPRIGQFWDNNIPADVEALCEGWMTAHPDFEYRRFSNVQAHSFLTEHKFAAALAAFKRATSAAMKADIFRLAYLAKCGGFYVDADDRCLAPLQHLDVGGRELILYQEENLGTTGNNFIGVTPGHPVIVSALNAAVAAVNRGDADILWLSTGPGLLTRHLAAYLAADLRSRLAKTLIIRPFELERSVGIWTLAAYKHTPQHWSRTAFSNARDLLHKISTSAS